MHKVSKSTLFAHFGLAEVTVAKAFTVKREFLLGNPFAVKLIAVDVFQNTFDFIVYRVQRDFNQAIIQVEKVWACQRLLRCDVIHITLREEEIVRLGVAHS